MAVMNILKYGSKTLHEPSSTINSVDEDVKTLISNMTETMYSAPGIGLAAPQVGVNRRVIVIDLSLGEDPEALLALVNPEILDSNGCELGEEGCLSVPGIFEDVERPTHVTVKGLDRNGDEVVIKAEGLMARALCHEIDHLEGILFVDRLGSIKKRFIKKDISRKIASGEWQV